MIGWRLYRTGTALVRRDGEPDTMWFSNPPELLVDLRGTEVDVVIDKIETAIDDYPYSGEYRTLPGPNSNTFTAFVGRRVPELRLVLPVTAIGKDYLEDGRFFTSAPGGRGFQISLFGLAGMIVGIEEGIEINLLGLVFGVDPLGPSIKLPGIGRIGFRGLEI